jgi:hypothetical protein
LNESDFCLSEKRYFYGKIFFEIFVDDFSKKIWEIQQI